MLDFFRPSKWNSWDDNPISNTFKPSHWDSWDSNPIINGVEDYYNTVTLQDDDGAINNIPTTVNQFGNSDGTDIANGEYGMPKDPWDNSDEIDEAIEVLNGNQDLMSQNYDATQNMLGSYLDTVNNLYKDSASNRNQAVSAYQNVGSYNPSTFQYNGDVNSFLSPAMDMRIREAKNAITKSQANAGNMFSSDYLDALNAKSQAIASEEYDKAFDRYNTDKNTALNEFKANSEEQHKAYDSESDMYKNLLSLYNGDLTNYLNGVGDYYGQMINASNAYTDGISNMNVAAANIKAGQDSWSRHLPEIVQSVGTIAGMAK